MPALDLLKAVAKAGGAKTEPALPPQIVRFTLEYAQAPDPLAERLWLEAWLQADGFALDLLDADLPTFLVLQFPGVLRTISTPGLFEMAAEIASARNLVSCTPDTGTTFAAQPSLDDPSAESAIGDAILKLTCWVDEDVSLAKHWALSSIRAEEAWELSRGTGIVIAQPDTGVAQHVELEAGALDLARAQNILNGTNDPTDPLVAGSGNPGHGTATSSVAVSRQTGALAGSAPDATLVPIRCVESVVFSIDGTPIARAVLHAIRIRADVISMSLGGPFYSPSLGEAIAKAVDAGIIVCAAAGNCVQPIVVYPAFDPNVIAIGGVNKLDKPWKGTSRGPKIDVCAPAENVFVARRRPGDEGHGTIEPSQGTSFATALTAGVAALWLARHGRDAVRAEAHKRNLTVHHLFRAALRASARPPAGGHWDPNSFGAGIVDAHALMQLPLQDIPAPPPLPESVPTSDPDAAVNAVMTEAATRSTSTFDWRRHGAEAVYLATDAWCRAEGARTMLVESAHKPRPSPGLEAAAPAVLRYALAQAANTPAIEPPIAKWPTTRNDLRILGARGTTGTESPAHISMEQARTNLSGVGRNEFLDFAKQTFERLDAESATPDAVAARQAVLNAADRVVSHVVSGQADGLGLDDVVALESLVRLKGRPAFRVIDGGIDPEDPLFGEMGGMLFAIPDLPRIASAVGRIDDEDGHVGTGFVVSPGVIMTNRHVLEAIAEEIRGPSGSTWVFRSATPVIDFAEKPPNPTARFRITGVIAAGPDAIQERVDFAHLDMALLAVEETNSSNTPLPPPYRLIGNTANLRLKDYLFTMGYPARPSTSAMIDPSTRRFSPEVARRLGQIFNVSYGQKYVSPGAIDSLGEGVRQWVFSHDATTLGGNSGSCVVSLSDPLGIVGLHFGGATLAANYAHSLAAVRASGLAAPLDAFQNWI